MPTVKTQDGKVVTKDGKVSCECCSSVIICINENFGIINTPLNRCAATPYGLRTISRPSGIAPAPASVPVRVRGFVDDEFLLNGAITQPGQFPFSIYPCNGAHPVTVDFTLSAATFTIAAGDNHGQQSSYSLQICFGGDPVSAP
jgi:hypothetical protein